METLFFTLLLHSLRAGIVVCVILLIRSLWGRRIAPSVRHALWIFVIAALILPGWFAIPVYESRVDNVNEVSKSTDQPTQTGETSNVVAAQPIDVIPTDNANTMVFLGPPEPLSQHLQPVEISREKTEADQRIRGPDEGEAYRPYRLRYRVIFVIWGFGAALLLTFSVGQVFRFSRRTQSRERIDDTEILSILDRALQKMKIRKTVGLFQSNRIATPLLSGILKPSILLPHDLC